MAERLATHAGFSWDVLAESPGTLPTTVRRSGGPWPLQWELRAVDATRRRGWVWDAVDATPARSNGQVSRRSIEPTDEYPLVLLVARNLFDGGEMAKRSQQLSAVTSGPFVELHPEEAKRRGISAGMAVAAYSSKGTTNAVLRLSENTPMGCAFMSLNQPNLRTNQIMTEGRWTLVEVGA
jgi:predicted molibdopterin-dependent oxidoreductase YjgC